MGGTDAEMRHGRTGWGDGIQRRRHPLSLKTKIAPHCIRHNYATVCWERGIDPYTTMRLMGHSSIKTTMDIYTHLNERQLAQISQKIEGLFEKQSCTKVAQNEEQWWMEK